MGVFVFLIIIGILGIGTFYFVLRATAIEIGDHEIGLIYKRFSLQHELRKRSVSAERLIALRGEPGCQAETLAPGVHLGYWPWMYTIRKELITKVLPGEIALVMAKDGSPMPFGNLLGQGVECDDFQNARAFLTRGGQKGRQLSILSAGEYRINTALFDIITTSNAPEYAVNPESLKVCIIATDKVGIVTTLIGRSTEEIAGPKIDGHSNFQDPQSFIQKGGSKGLQEELILAGAYQLNPWFVQVEQESLVVVPPGTVGVVISLVGKNPPIEAVDQLVEDGYRGVCRRPLGSGKYAINPRIMRIKVVPTHQITLDWSSNKEKAPSNYDSQLHTLRLRSKDGFLFGIEVTQVIRILGEDAPKMIARVGSADNDESEYVLDRKSGAQKFNSIRHLVMRVLESMVGNYFRNSAQDYQALDFHEKRSERQREAVAHIKNALSSFGVQAVGTFINEIDLPEQLETVLTERKVAEERRKIELIELEAEQSHQALARARAVTEMQQELVRAEFSVRIAKLVADARRLTDKVEFEALQQRIEAEIRGLGGSTKDYMETQRIKQFPNLRLPNVWVGGNSDISDAFFAQALGAPSAEEKQLDNPQLLELLAMQNGESAKLAYMRLKGLVNNPNPSESDISQLINMLKQFGFSPIQQRELPGDTDYSIESKS